MERRQILERNVHKLIINYLHSINGNLESPEYWLLNHFEKYPNIGVFNFFILLVLAMLNSEHFIQTLRSACEAVSLLC